MRSHMCPSSAMLNVPNSVRRDAELGSNRACRHAVPKQSANAEHIVAGQLCIGVALALCRSPFSRHVGTIISRRANKEMIGVEAATVITAMQDIEATLNVESLPNPSRDTVHASRVILQANASIAGARGNKSCPIPTPRHRIDLALRQKPLGSALASHAMCRPPAGARAVRPCFHNRCWCAVKGCAAGVTYTGDSLRPRLQVATSGTVQAIAFGGARSPYLKRRTADFTCSGDTLGGHRMLQSSDVRPGLRSKRSPAFRCLDTNSITYTVAARALWPALEAA